MYFINTRETSAVSYVLYQVYSSITENEVLRSHWRFLSRQRKSIYARDNGQIF